MATLKHTPLRHRMLAEVARADRPITRRQAFDPAKPAVYAHTERQLTTGEARTLRDLHDLRLITGHGPMPSRLYAPWKREETPAGSALLSEWNDKHGNPLAEESE